MKFWFAFHISTNHSPHNILKEILFGFSSYELRLSHCIEGKEGLSSLYYNQSGSSAGLKENVQMFRNWGVYQSVKSKTVESNNLLSCWISMVFVVKDALPLLIQKKETKKEFQRKNAFLLLLRRYFNVVKYEDETFPRQFLKPARNKAGSLSIYFVS